MMTISNIQRINSRKGLFNGSYRKVITNNPHSVSYAIFRLKIIHR